MIGPFFVALQFLTRLPVPLRSAPTEGSLGTSALYYPLVGALVGLLGAGVYLALGQVLPLPAALLLALGAAVLLTGGLHEDGLADCADAFGAARDRVRALEIMRDSRIGVFGALALLFAVGLKLALLLSLDPWEAAKGLIAGHALSRWLVLPLALIFPIAREDGLGAAFARSLRIWHLLGSTLFAVALGSLLYGALCAALLPLPLACLLIWGLLSWRKIGGVTGDVLGASVQLTEVAFYAGLVLFSPHD